MSAEVELAAPAKVNLFLEVVGRRADGYHELVTLMQRVDLADILRATRVEGGASGVRVRCDAPGLPEDLDNLAGQAARLALDAIGTSEGVAIDIAKRIPAGAGLGGGSSDAAAALLAVNQLFGEPLDEPALLALAARVGSDVPFFVVPGLVRCTGTGTVIDRRAPAPAWAATLLLPEHHVSTPGVYGRLRELPRWEPVDDTALWDALEGGAPVSEWAPLMHNRLEDAACAASPMDALRRALRERLPGVMISGSGSAFFEVRDPGEPAPKLPARLELSGLPAIRVVQVRGGG